MTDTLVALAATASQVLNRDLSITMIRLFAERRLRDKMEKALKREGHAPDVIKQKLSEVDWSEKVLRRPVLA